MNRITRCPSCATIYQVGDAQLRQARGWLRCSQCEQAFDSTGLVLAWAPPSAFAPISSASELAVGAVVSSPDGSAERVDLKPLLLTPDPIAPGTPASQELASFEQALSSFRPGALLDPGLSQASEPAPLSPSEPPAKSLASGVFMVVGLVGALLLQLIFAQSSTLAAHWPGITPGLERACSWVGCHVAPLRDPEALVIESSGFVQRDSDYVVSWTLRNTSTQTLGVTAMELSLLDAQDQVLVRRVLQAPLWGGPESLAPRQVDAAQLAVQVDPGLSVSTYRLLSFYP